MEQRLDEFFNCLYQQQSAKWSDPTHQREEKQAALKKVLGLDKLEAMALKPQTKTEGLEDFSDYSIQQLTMTILPGLTMPVYIVQPKKPNGKSILYSHGHGAGGCRACFTETTPPAYHKNIPLRLARRGYAVYLYEPAGFGEFKVTDYKTPEDSSCYPLTMRLHLYGITTAGLRVFQAMSLARYMREEKGVTDFATVGISGGGTIGALYGALDDSTKANVISCYSNLFKTSIMAMHHCVDNFVPGLLEIGELPHIIALGAPKYLFLSNGANDPIYPIDGAKAAYSIVKDVYEKLNVPQKLKQEFFEGAHEFSEAFIDWLDKIL